MAKSRRTISAKLPTYQKDRRQWRKKIRQTLRVGLVTTKSNVIMAAQNPGGENPTFKIVSS